MTPRRRRAEYVLGRMARVTHAPPPPRPSCASCKMFAPEVLVPIGAGAAEMCWLCAHRVVEHGCTVENAAGYADCSCAADEVYPADVVERRVGKAAYDAFEQAGFKLQHGDVTREMIERATPEQLLRGSSLSDACAARPVSEAALRVVTNGSLTHRK